MINKLSKYNFRRRDQPSYPLVIASLNKTGLNSYTRTIQSTQIHCHEYSANNINQCPQIPQSILHFIDHKLPIKPSVFLGRSHMITDRGVKRLQKGNPRCIQLRACFGHKDIDPPNQADNLRNGTALLLRSLHRIEEARSILSGPGSRRITVLPRHSPLVWGRDP